MTPDRELLAFTAFAALLFGTFALFFQTYLSRSKRLSRMRPPPPALILIFRLWFGALALGALYLTLFGRYGLFPR